jgi:predicted DNA-binding WGR domain protein
VVNTPPESTTVRVFLCTEGDFRKFWRVHVAECVQTVCYGRIGTDGHQLTKTFESETAARQATEKLISQKLGKGYREVSSSLLRTAITIRQLQLFDDTEPEAIPEPVPTLTLDF